MTVSFNGTFNGDVFTSKHRTIATEIKGAVEAILAANGASGSVTLSAKVTQNQVVNVVTGENLGTPYETKTMDLWCTFHANEDPTPAPTPEVAEQPTEQVVEATTTTDTTTQA